MWSKTKRAIKNLWCDSLKRRVDVHFTTYPTNAECGRVWFTVDGEQWLEIRDCDYCAAWMKVRRRGERTEPNRDQFVHTSDFFACVSNYLSSNFDDLIHREEPLAQVLAALDRRLGKRRLRKIDWSRISDQARPFYELRCAAEEIQAPDGYDLR